MSSHAPAVSVALDQAGAYLAGGQLVATATIVDPDTYTEVINSGVDQIGVPTSVTVAHTDTAGIAWSWKSTGTQFAAGTNPLTCPVPVVSDVLVATVTDAEGNTTSAEIAVPVLIRTMFGVTPDSLAPVATASAYTAHIAEYPGSKCARAYGAAGAGVPADTSKLVAPLIAAGMRVYKSAKDLDVAAYVADWDKLTRTTGYSPWHECNRPADQHPVDFAAWSAFVPKLLDARDRHPNRHLIEIGPCATWYPAAIGHNEGTPWGRWFDVGRGRWDFVGWDFYNPSAGSCHDPADMIALPVASAKEYGVPLVVGECGIQAITGDIGDVKAAAWLTTVADLLAKSGLCEAWMLWCSQVQGQVSYHLDSRPAALKAVRALLAAQH